MRTELDHLPPQKQRELERVVQLIFEEFDDAFALAKHEWKKHGTCSGLAADQYFNEALRAMSLLPGNRGTPKLISEHVGGAVPATELRGSYAKRVALKADKACRLSEVTSCWAKRPDGTVGGQIDCPEHVMRGRDSPQCASYKLTALGQCLAGDGQKKGRR